MHVKGLLHLVTLQSSLGSVQDLTTEGLWFDPNLSPYFFDD